jgi:futalosine hydrolase
MAVNRPQVVLNLGIAGAFDDALPIGSVVQVAQDRLAEMGVEDNGQFIPMDATGLVPINELLFTTDLRLHSMEAVLGITVNRVHGNADSIKAVRQLYAPQTESMEGAAVAYVCQTFGVPWVQVRAISNRVEPRDRSKWNIPLALTNLHAQLPNILAQLHEL